MEKTRFFQQFDKVEILHNPRLKKGEKDTADLTKDTTLDEARKAYKEKFKDDPEPTATAQELMELMGTIPIVSTPPPPPPLDDLRDQYRKIVGKEPSKIATEKSMFKAIEKAK